MNIYIVIEIIRKFNFRALGQGAFGEVYQGLYRHRDGDAIEMPVAVKTLPEMSTGQSETDFLMEAAIMAKFNHPNIVHLIGVCFDRHPRFMSSQFYKYYSYIYKDFS